MRKTTIVCTIGPGVIPILISNFKNTDDMIERAEQIVKNTGWVKPGDRVVLTAGIATGISGQTNMIKIIKIP